MRKILPVLMGLTFLLLTSTEGWSDGSKVDRLNKIYAEGTYFWDKGGL